MKKPQTLSLQEQLLKSGLSNDAKLKQVKAEKRKQTKLERNNGVEIVDDVKLSAEQLRQQQAERDRELNRQRKLADEQKALAAQIRQIVDLNRIAPDPNGVAYNFSDGSKVKTLYLAEKTRAALVNGRAGIARVDDRYEIVPAEIARKVLARDAGSIVVLNEATEDLTGEDDPYAAYQVPDDLMW